MAFTHPDPQLPVLGFGLSSSAHLDVEALAAALLENSEVGVRVVDLPAREGRPAARTVAVETDDVVVLVTPVDAPVPAAEAVRACHPLWWTDPTPVAQHASHTIITALPQRGRSVDRPLVVLIASIFSVVASVLMEQPDAVALYFGSGGITYPARRYAGQVIESLEAGAAPVDLWTSVWLQPQPDGTVSGHTIGLDTFGHADLLVERSTHTLAEVYERLAMLAAYVITTAESLQPGVPLAFSPTERLEVEPVASDAHPLGALRVRY